VIPPISKAAENSFNAVRLLAALQVAYVHAVAHLHLDRGFGMDWIVQFPGVPIFFAVSGYLVFDSLLRLPLREFVAHRAARIYPALIVNILIIETALYVAGQISFDGTGPVRNAAYFLSYAATASDGLASLWTGSSGGARTFDGFFKMYPSGVLWTLTVELTFYLAIPLFAIGRSRVIQTLLIIAASATSVAYQKYLGASIVTYDAWPISVFVFPYFWMFGIGMLFRLWLPPAWAIKPAILVLLGVFAALAWTRHLAWFEWKLDPTAVTTIQAVTLCLLALCVGCSPILKSKWLAKNDMSYGLYLYHMLIVTALMNAAPSRWLLIVALGGGMIAGWLSWHLIERPAMRRARKKSLRDSSNRGPRGAAVGVDIHPVIGGGTISPQIERPFRGG
jgi:peptidoglycan/LPS O-acetylase OafA/YrhL